MRGAAGRLSDGAWRVIAGYFGAGQRYAFARNRRNPMPNRPSLNTVRSAFDRRVTSARDLYDAVEAYASGTWYSIQGWELLYPGQARRVVALAFMQLVMGWEDLVEGCFVRYLTGAAAPDGSGPRLRVGAASTMDHAYKLVSGNPAFRRGSDYLNWSKWGEVVDRAKLFFVRGEPFCRLTQLERARLADATKMRNRVAHSSQKCRKEFVEVAKTHLGIAASGKLPRGFDLGQLLVNKSSRCFGANAAARPYFHHYEAIFGQMAQRVCPV